MGNTIRITSEGTLWTLPWDIGITKGFFREEGIQPEVIRPDSELEPAPVFERPIACDYEAGDLEGYNKCEWGVIKRAADGQRDGWILGKRESVATMAILVRGDSPPSPVGRPLPGSDFRSRPDRVPLHDFKNA